MKIQLRGSAISPQQQQANDKHRTLVVCAVLLLLAIYAYLLTDVSETLHLPYPQDLVEKTGVSVEHVFDSDRNVDSHLYIQKTTRYHSDDERLILFGVITGAFLCTYFLPLGAKRPSFVLWFLVGYGTLYGLHATAAFVSAHLAVYLIFHPESRQVPVASGLFGVLLAWSIFQRHLSVEVTLLAAGLLGTFAFLFHTLLLTPVLMQGTRLASLLRGFVVQFPLLFGLGGAILERCHVRMWTLPIGFVFFLWQWQRLMLYYVDYREGDVPKDLSLFGYFATFLSPAVLANFRYAPYVGQGYAYLSSNFLCDDKNKIVMSGFRLWCLALFYLVVADWIVAGFVTVMGHWGITVYPYTNVMVRRYIQGTRMSTPTVLISTMLDQYRIFLVYGAVTHFRVGTWRVFGYRMDPQYNRPWLATNLVSLWGRFAFHYREFLVRTFYYPSFFRFFKKRRSLRIFTATMIAACVGNLIWGHIPDRMYSRGMTWDNLMLLLRAWPYYVLLGTGIALTQIYLLRKGRTRKPWTLDRRIFLDVLCAYCTFQFFSLIHIFARPCPGSTLWDAACLFLRGFGITV